MKKENLRDTTTRPPMVVCKMEAQLKYMHIAYTFFARLVPICMLSRCLLAIFLHQSSVRSLLSALLVRKYYNQYTYTHTSIHSITYAGRNWHLRTFCGHLLVRTMSAVNKSGKSESSESLDGKRTRKRFPTTTTTAFIVVQKLKG